MLTQIRSVQVFEFASLTHESVGALAVVEDGVCDFDGEARSAVEAVPGGVGRRAGVRLEGDVGADGTLAGWAWLRRGARRACR